MREIKFNVIGIITFIIFLLLEFVIDIVKGRGGSSETFSLLFIVGLVVMYIFRPFWTLRRYLSLRLDTALGHCFG